MGRLQYIQCDMCGKVIDPPETRGYFVGAQWVDSTPFDLCPKCSVLVQKYINEYRREEHLPYLNVLEKE